MFAQAVPDYLIVLFTITSTNNNGDVAVPYDSLWKHKQFYKHIVVKAKGYIFKSKCKF